MSETPNPAEKHPKKIQLTPTLSGNAPGTPLFDYFVNKLPPDLPRSTYRQLTCIGYSRLILQELGGPKKARIYWVEIEDDIGETLCHAYVIPNDAKPTDLAYNNNLESIGLLTVD